MSIFSRDLQYNIIENQQQKNAFSNIYIHSKIWRQLIFANVAEFANFVKINGRKN